MKRQHCLKGKVCCYYVLSLVSIILYIDNSFTTKWARIDAVPADTVKYYEAIASHNKQYIIIILLCVGYTEALCRLQE